MEITGRLENWKVVKHYNKLALVGNLYDDIHGRWFDGAQIISSALLPMSMQATIACKNAVMRTRNSAYLLGEPHATKPNV